MATFGRAAGAMGVALAARIDTSHAGLDGAALYNTGRAVIVNSDFTVNFALTLTGINNGDGVEIFNAAGTVTLRHSIVVQNSPSNCTPLGSVPGCTG